PQRDRAVVPLVGRPRRVPLGGRHLPLRRRPPRPPLPRRPVARLDDQPHLDRVGRADHLWRRGRGGGLRERRVRAGRCVVRRDYRPGEGPMRGLVVSAPLALLVWAAVAAVVGWWLS